ncbi:MAG: hypothetical protein IT422_22070 [Pirellulaceae bacterium]|nr:hypothetical protein [Pirellulaceae bacterium]
MRTIEKSWWWVATMLCYGSIPLATILAGTGTTQDLNPELQRSLKKGVLDAQERFDRQVVYGDFRFLSYDSKHHDVKIGILKSNHILRIGPWFQDLSTDSIQVMNPRYVFELTKAARAKRFSLNRIAERKNLTNEQTEQIELTAQQVYDPVFGNYRVSGWFVWDLLNSPRCSLRSIRETTESGTSLVEVAYSLKGSTEGFSGNQAGMNGTFSCDPNRLWSIVRETITLGVDGGLANSSEFEITTVGDDQLPILKKSTGSGFDGRGKKLYTNIMYEFVAEDNGPLTEDMFYLSHYGFPEPNFGKSWMGLWLLYLIAGVALVLTGRYLVKRRH